MYSHRVYTFEKLGNSVQKSDDYLKKKQQTDGRTGRIKNFMPLCRKWLGHTNQENEDSHLPLSSTAC